jgi:hypothetical protein
VNLGGEVAYFGERAGENIFRKWSGVGRWLRLVWARQKKELVGGLAVRQKAR